MPDINVKYLHNVLFSHRDVMIRPRVSGIILGGIVVVVVIVVMIQLK